MRIELGDGAYLDAHIAKTSPELTMPPRPAVIVFPGGGYVFCSAREAEPVANQYIAAGCNTFTLFYRIGDDAVNKHPLIDAARAIDHVRKHAEEYGIDKEKIAVIGFSAGGHLATWISSAYNDEALKGLDCRPNACMAGYPVINYNASCLRVLLGKDNPADDDTVLEMFRTDKMVHKDTPPMFLWTTFEDSLVPVQSTMFMGMALADNGVPVEMHIFPHGDHGLSICTEETTPAGAPKYEDAYIGRWVEMSVMWLNKLFNRL